MRTLSFEPGEAGLKNGRAAVIDDHDGKIVVTSSEGRIRAPDMAGAIYILNEGDLIIEASVQGIDTDFVFLTISRWENGQTWPTHKFDARQKKWTGDSLPPKWLWPAIEKAEKLELLLNKVVVLPSYTFTY